MLNDDSDLDLLVRQQVASGEVLVWSQRASPDGLARRVRSIVKSGCVMTAFAIVWTLFAGGIVFLVSSKGSAGGVTPRGQVASSASANGGTEGAAGARGGANGPPGSGGDPQEGVPSVVQFGFPLFGVVFIAGGTWVARAGTRARKWRVAYGVTPSRAFVVEINRKGERTSREYRGAELQRLSVLERADGTGDIVFEGVQRPEDSRIRINGSPIPVHGFWGVENVQAVRREIEKISR